MTEGDDDASSNEASKLGAELDDDPGFDGVHCCLYWMLTFREHAKVLPPVLKRFHGQVVQSSLFFGAEPIVLDAVHGVIVCKPVEKAGMSAEDVAVRLGQTFCRWAVGQDPAFHIRIGVHTGELESLRLQVGEARCSSHFGDAYNQAWQLAASAEYDNMVHLSQEARDGLQALERVTLAVAVNRSMLFVGGAESYYLDAYTEITKSEFRSSVSNKCWQEEQSETGSPRRFGSIGRTSSFAHENLTVDGFKEQLSLSGFFIEPALEDDPEQMQNLYVDVVEQNTAYLEKSEDASTVRRVVQEIHLTIQVLDKSSQLRELRRVSQAQETEQITLPLSSYQESWAEALSDLVEERFGVSAEVQEACFEVHHEAYFFREEAFPSRTFAGICDVLQTHYVSLTIHDVQHSALRILGLPEAQDFTLSVQGATYSCTWAHVTDSDEPQERQLLRLLRSYHVDVSKWKPNAFTDLYEELYEKGQASLEMHGQDLVRRIRVLKVYVHAEVLTRDHVLLVKSKAVGDDAEEHVVDRPLTMMMSEEDSWESALMKALSRRIGLTEDLQEQFVVTDPAAINVLVETDYSYSYPGLKTCYKIYEVKVRINDPMAPALQFIGLPNGDAFNFERLVRKESHALVRRSTSCVEKEGRPANSDPVTRTTWRWKPTSEQAAEKSVTEVRRARRASYTDKCRLPLVKGSTPKLGVPLPRPLEPYPSGGCHNLLSAMMHGMQTDWDLARRAASRIRDEDYNLRDFHDDVVAAFPELRLYLGQSSQNTSGRTGADEYQRTIGALFAIFWLLRQHLDGKECFCFGVRSDWTTRGAHDINDRDESCKREAFYANANWCRFRDLFLDAGLLYVEQDGAIKHDAERTLAMLVLMAIHDIMKVSDFLPVVEREPFRGYMVGECIGDHDVALSYILERHPDCLPSFAGLPQASQHAVKFTHVKMDYNMGWLVQAEAPPGALFKTFRHVVRNGEASSMDIAFYFVHWVADLAGAEPYPREGCEKFVLKFPQQVLMAFLDSFRIVRKLSTSASETEVYENYLEWRWSQHQPALGRAPTGCGAIACMRLIVMAQGDSEGIINELALLPEDDKAVLERELALTGCGGQLYRRDAGFDKGPAFLVYYAPALMQKAGKQLPGVALVVLAEVFRKARKLWPLNEDDADSCVTVRIDTLKDQDASALTQVNLAMLPVISRTSDKDGAVKHVPIGQLYALDWSREDVLDFQQRASMLSTVSRTPSKSKLLLRSSTLTGLPSH